MNQERRQHKRVTRPFEGSWRGASGGSSCRISDVSLGGCFVQTLATPSAGDETHVTITFGKDLSMTFVGKVAYVEPKMGFAVKFNELDGDGTEAVQRLLDALGGRESKL
ncbi:MAG TPA: PilZ domain-containing protein [Vicinamibacterales bacterium]|nr:PilZ domain-containing protein [Vicinamibacterales bacterium]